MVTATIQEAQVHLPSLIAQLKPGEELVIIERNRPVARLVAEPSEETGPRKPGIAIGKLKIIEDDDAHLDDFKEYMP
jgi:antitoxin (DNA-binding transcriptional repressor) of toxin-antitoxin stability system